MSATPNDLRRLFADHGQEHVFAHWDALDEAGRAELLDDCHRVDFDWLEARIDQYRQEKAATHEPLSIEPAPVIELPRTEEDYRRREEAYEVGARALARGEVAAFCVAGGQGTRLGFDGPKGCYPAGPVTDRSLFQWHCEQISARAAKYGKPIPFYVMTSRANDDATRAFFREHAWFGLGRENVMFFTQRMVPSVDFDGKLILAEKSRLAMNPDGHGGCLWALAQSGALDGMTGRGIKTVSYIQVDNPLVTIADPVFLGYHLEAEAQMSSKVLEKACPEEKVGHVCYLDGTLTVIEYSDLDEKNMHMRDENGKLVFWAGSIAIHMIDVAFAGAMGREAKLPWHIARKKIPFFDGREVVQPGEPNGVKFETFVFDALPFTEAGVTVEVAREDEFAPIKNKTGVDSAESCARLLSNRFARWLEAAGVEVPRDGEGNAAVKIEIAPTYALTPEQLIERLPDGLTVTDDLVLAP